MKTPFQRDTSFDHSAAIQGHQKLYKLYPALAETDQLIPFQYTPAEECALQLVSLVEVFRASSSSEDLTDTIIKKIVKTLKASCASFEDLLEVCLQHPLIYQWFLDFMKKRSIKQLRVLLKHLEALGVCMNSASMLLALYIQQRALRGEKDQEDLSSLCV